MSEREESDVDRDPLMGLVEIRHVDGSTRAAYNAIYSDVGIRHPDRLWEWILDLVDARAGMRLLDVACGEAEMVRHAAERGLEAHGVDLSEVALRTGRSAAAQCGEGSIGLHTANGEALPFPDGFFDRVTNMGSLEHYDNPVQGAAEMARVLKDDGLVCLHVPNTFGLRWNVLHAWRTGDVADDGQPIQRYGTRGQWTRVLEAGGLAVVEVRGYEELGHFPVGLSGWLGVLRHPSRLLVPLVKWLPSNMASILLFVCRRADPVEKSTLDDAIANRRSRVAQQPESVSEDALSRGAAGSISDGSVDSASTRNAADDPRSLEVARLQAETPAAFDVRRDFDWGEKEFAHWRSTGAGGPKRPGEVILVIRRDVGDVLLHTKAFYPSGSWRMLTGGIDGDEPLEAAVSRELAEETGFNASQPRYIGRLRYTFSHNGDQIHFVSYAFIINVGASLVPRPEDDAEQITAFRWTSAEGLSDIAADLGSLEGEWADWGRFRAVAHDAVSKVLPAQHGRDEVGVSDLSVLSSDDHAIP